MKTISLIVTLSLVILFSFQNCELPQKSLEEVKKNSDSFYLDSEPSKNIFYQDDIAKNESVQLFDHGFFSSLVKDFENNNISYEANDQTVTKSLENKDAVLELLSNTKFYRTKLPDDMVCILLYKQSWAEITFKNEKNIRLFKVIDVCQSKFFLDNPDINAFENLEAEIKALLAN